jgi:hypothetical protein
MKVGDYLQRTAGLKDRCRWLWVKVPGYVSVTSVTAERAACSSTMAFPAV